METRILYEGHRRSICGGQEVIIRREPEGSVLPLLPTKSLSLRRHSPSGFNWGYLGSGPAQLALALLLDATGDEQLSLRHYQDFKFMEVANWGEDWYISRDEILDWLDSRESAILAENLCQN